MKDGIRLMKPNKNMYGLLSAKDIRWEIKNNNIFIHPYSDKNLTEVGYNLSPSDFVYSVRKGMLLEVIQDGSDRYVQVPGNDTVLVLTKEYVSVSKRIGGTFHSRVREVSQGFGHISTTLDPGWYGPLLIAVTNPSRKRRLNICTHSSKGADNNTFATMVLHYLSTEAEGKHDNQPFRFDVLEHWYNKFTWLKKRFNKSTILLDEIISLAKSMCPDRADPSIPTTVFDEFQKFLADKLENARDDTALLASELYRMQYDFRDMRNVCSSTYAKQYDRVINLLEGKKAEDEDADLLTTTRALLDSCFYEKRRMRWDYYSGQLTKKISKYRTNRLLELLIHVRENMLRYIIFMISFMILTVYLLRYRGIVDHISFSEAVVAALVAFVCTMLSSIFANK